MKIAKWGKIAAYVKPSDVGVLRIWTTVDELVASNKKPEKCKEKL